MTFSQLFVYYMIKTIFKIVLLWKYFLLTLRNTKNAWNCVNIAPHEFYEFIHEFN